MFNRHNVAQRREDGMASKDFDKERRDLYAVALLISVYCLAGAELGDRFNSPISAKVQFPQVVMGAFVVAWLYFIWRYWLAIGQSNYESERDICKYHESNDIFRNATAKVLEHRLALMSDGNNGIWSEVWGRLSPDTRSRLAKDAQLLPGAKPFTSNAKLSWINYQSVGWPESISPGREARLEIAAKELGMSPVKWWPWKRARIVASGIWRAMWAKRTFSDRWLPFIVGVGLPPIAFVLRVTLPIYR
jgi:hypothetical protein